MASGERTVIALELHPKSGVTPEDIESAVVNHLFSAMHELFVGHFRPPHPSDVGSAAGNRVVREQRP